MISLSLVTASWAPQHRYLSNLSPTSPPSHPNDKTPSPQNQGMSTISLSHHHHRSDRSHRRAVTPLSLRYHPTHPLHDWGPPLCKAFLARGQALHLFSVIHAPRVLALFRSHPLFPPGDISLRTPHYSHQADYQRLRRALSPPRLPN